MSEPDAAPEARPEDGAGPVPGDHGQAPPMPGQGDLFAPTEPATADGGGAAASGAAVAEPAATDPVAEPAAGADAAAEPEAATDPVAEPEAAPSAAAPSPEPEAASAAASAPRPVPHPRPGAPVAPATPEPASPPAPPPSNPAEFGRVDADGTVYVRTASGERAVGSWQAGEPDEGLAFFGRKYDALAAEVELIAARLDSGSADLTASGAALDKLAGTVPDAAAVGDLDGLMARIEELRGVLATKAEERKARRARREAANVARKTALAEEAEQLATSEDWKSAGERMRAILEEWKTIRVERAADAALWQRYRAARDTFTKRRGAHFAQLDEQRKSAVAAKQALVAEAESLASSTEWGPTATKFRDLMTRWKAAPRATKEAEDRLWAAYKAAQDRFFDARSAAFSARDTEQQANAAAKEAIIAEAEGLSLANPGAALTRLRALQERYDAAGRVPRERMTALDERMRAAEQRVRSAADASRSQQRPGTPSTMVVRLEESIAKLERRLERARAADDRATVEETEEALRTQRSWLAQAER